jgi:hypothetical protein
MHFSFDHNVHKYTVTKGNGYNMHKHQKVLNQLAQVTILHRDFY